MLNEKEQKAVVAAHGLAHEVDLTIAAFDAAMDVYAGKELLSRDDMRSAVERLDKFKMFSASQLSAISGMAPATLRKYAFGRGVPGGRFDPEALSTLKLMYRMQKDGQDLSVPLLRIAMQSGCSAHVVARMTGIHHSKIYRLMSRL